MRDVLKALETSEAEHAEAAGGGARVLEAVSSSRKALGFSPGGQEMLGKSDKLDDGIFQVSSHKFCSCEESVDDLEKSSYYTYIQ